MNLRKLLINFTTLIFILGIISCDNENVFITYRVTVGTSGVPAESAKIHYYENDELIIISTKLPWSYEYEAIRGLNARMDVSTVFPGNGIVKCFIYKNGDLCDEDSGITASANCSF